MNESKFAIHVVLMCTVGFLLLPVFYVMGRFRKAPTWRERLFNGIIERR